MTNVKGSFEFTRKERITHPQEFKDVMKFGKRIPSKNLILFMKGNKNPFHRLGIVVSREVGKSTYRNRIKRLLREFFRLHKSHIIRAADMVVLAKRGCVLRRYGEVEEELGRLLCK